MYSSTGSRQIQLSSVLRWKSPASGTSNKSTEMTIPNENQDNLQDLNLL